MSKKNISNKIAAFVACITLGCGCAAAETHFNNNFCDSTLRLDYIIGGVNGNVGISLKQKHLKEGWAGRKNRLDSLAYAGNCEVNVSDLKGNTLYRNSFSTLFCEWLDLKEAHPMAQECPLFVPFPKDTVDVSLTIFDKYHQPIANSVHRISPTDILIKKSKKMPLPHKVLYTGDWSGDKVRVAIMAEGYTQEEMPLFEKDAQETIDAILQHEPFSSLKDRMEFVAVYSPSADSGVSVPLKDDWKDTAFSSHFSTFYSDRYLTSGAVFDIYDALHGILADHIIILANTDVYGGGGIFNFYTLTASHHANFRPVVVHEFGHSFGGLGDEYFYEQEVMADTYPTDVEPWEPNITTLVNFDSKWKNLVPSDTPMPTNPEDADKYPIGLYEGGGYSFHGIYRPAFDCRMRTNTCETFCPGCQNALSYIIKFYTD